MRNKFTWFGIVAILLLGTGICLVGCKDDLNAVVHYVGKVVYSGTTTPFSDLEVKVTNGIKIHCVSHTDEKGSFELVVKVDEIDDSYYLLAGDSTCVPKKVKLSGYGQEKVDLGVIDVEGPTLPVVITLPISNVLTDKAVSGGNVTADGRSTVTARGVCWSKTEDPTVSDSHTTNGSGTGEFESQLTGLEYNTVYYVRAYATNRLGTAYGNQVKFSTMSGKAEVLTDSVYAVTAVSAKCAGRVTDDGGFKVSARGVCWAKSPDPTTTDYIANEGSGKGTFVCALRNLDINAVYYVRAFATNETGTFYGEQVKIQTLDGMAVVELNSIKDITATSATVNAVVTYDCDIAVTERGVCWSTNQYPMADGSHVVTGRGMGSYVSSITKLEYGTRYYVRAYATNSTGTAYSEQQTFTTSDGKAKVSTTKATNITATGATCGGNVTDDGTLTVTARGVCYGTTQYPTIENDHTTDGKGKGTFTSTLKSLSPGTSYYYRAYATTSAGTVYGEQMTLKTASGLATVTTVDAANITAISATCGGNVTDDGTMTVTARGVCYATTQYPTIENDHTTDGKGKGTFTSSLNNLNDKTTYYYRAYATTDAGTAYGEQKSFTTIDGSAAVTLGEVSDIKAASAIWTATVTSDGGVKVTERGICYATSQYPTTDGTHTIVGNGTGDFTCTLTGLTPDKLYYVRAYATNAVGTVYSEQKSFTTLNGLPVVTTATEVSNILATTARGGGEVTDDGGFAVTAYGLCWNTASNPNIEGSHSVNGKGKAAFTGEMTGLSANTKYYVRAYATNEVGTVYGENVQFTTTKGVASIKTTAITSITALTATGGGNVTDAGGATIKAVGICWATTQNPTIAGNHTTDGSSLGSFTSNMTGLKQSTTYYVRAYCTTDVTTNYGDQVSFTTISGLPVVTTAECSVTASTISTGGNITDDSGYGITARGVCWSATNSNPDLKDKFTNDGKGKGSFTSYISELNPNTTYYVRAYATNQFGTAYGSAITVKTKDGKAGITTSKITNITALTAIGGGNITDAGGATIKAVGICWATTQNPTIAGSHTTDGSSLGSFTSNMTGLKPSTTYYVRAYCTTNVATNYGDQVSFTTISGLPVVTTAECSATASTISTGGNITDDSGYGITARGVCWSATNSNPDLKDKFTTDGKGKGSFTSFISELSPNTTYYVRAYATNQFGSAYGKTITVKTKDGKATITTADVTNITDKTAIGGGKVTDAGGATIKAIGTCWATTQNPTISGSHTTDGNSLGSFTSNLTGLKPSTTYYVRAYCTTDINTNYGDQVSFTTISGLPILMSAETTATSTTITSGGNITSDGGYNITARGVCYSTNNSAPTIADSFTTNGVGSGSFTSIITSVSVNTTYYVRAYATNSIGTSYGNTMIIKTGNGLPIVETINPGENISNSTISTGGNIIDDGGYNVTNRGVVYATTPTPTLTDAESVNSGNGLGYFTSLIANIDVASNNYYVRAYATNINGTTYGEQYIVTPEKLEYVNLPTFAYGGYKYHLYYDMGIMAQEQGINACNNLVFGGYRDWFLPSVTELTAAAQAKLAGWVSMSNDTTIYWSSTTVVDFPYYYHYYVGIKIVGGIGYLIKATNYMDDGINRGFRIRAVRKDPFEQ